MFKNVVILFVETTRGDDADFTSASTDKLLDICEVIDT